MFTRKDQNPTQPVTEQGALPGLDLGQYLLTTLKPHLEVLLRRLLHTGLLLGLISGLVAGVLVAALA